MPLPVGEGEDEYAVPQAIAPGALEQISIGVPQQTLPVLLAASPVAFVHVAVGEDVLAIPCLGGGFIAIDGEISTVKLVNPLPVSAVILELSEVLVAGIWPVGPPELAKPLLHSPNVIA